MKKILLLTSLAILTYSCKTANTTTTKNDGLSMENAIKVKDVPSEYRYLKENCEGCQLQTQALSHKGAKYYDVMTVTTKDGATKVYYFDITSFFGKF